jgi:hypothetical protein
MGKLSVEQRNQILTTQRTKCNISALTNFSDDANDVSGITPGDYSYAAYLQPDYHEYNGDYNEYHDIAILIKLPHIHIHLLQLMIVLSVVIQTKMLVINLVNILILILDPNDLLGCLNPLLVMPQQDNNRFPTTHKFLKCVLNV